MMELSGVHAHPDAPVAPQSRARPRAA